MSGAEEGITEQTGAEAREARSEVLERDSAFLGEGKVQDRRENSVLSIGKLGTVYLINVP